MSFFPNGVNSIQFLFSLKNSSWFFIILKTSFLCIFRPWDFVFYLFYLYLLIDSSDILCIPIGPFGKKDMRAPEINL